MRTLEGGGGSLTPEQVGTLVVPGRMTMCRVSWTSGSLGEPGALVREGWGCSCRRESSPDWRQGEVPKGGLRLLRRPTEPHVDPRPVVGPGALSSEEHTKPLV